MIRSSIFDCLNPLQHLNMSDFKPNAEVNNTKHMRKWHGEARKKPGGRSSTQGSEARVLGTLPPAKAASRHDD